MSDATYSVLTAWLFENGLSLYFGTLLCSLVGFACLELRWPRRGDGADRRRRWPINFVLFVFVFVIQLLAPISALIAAIWAQQHRIGVLNVSGLPLWATGVLTFVLADLANYARHVAMHKLPVLWRMHKVHHCDTAVDISTFGRFHPLEIIPELAVGLFAVILLGFSPAALFVYELCSITFNIFEHANLGLPRSFDRNLRSIVVTPDMHRVHHSSWQPHTDSNYGVVLAIWDRLFRTYQSGAERGPGTARIGLADIAPAEAGNLVEQLRLPFAALSRGRRQSS